MTFWLALSGGTMVCCLFILFLARLAFVAIRIEGGSMEPTFCHGEILLIYRWWPLRSLRKGQVALLQPSGSLTFRQRSALLPTNAYVKRIVGVGGEEIITSLDELQEGLRKRQKAEHDERGNRTWHIPAGEIFVCGDNLMGSIDSRQWGPIPTHNVFGIVVMKLQ